MKKVPEINAATISPEVLNEGRFQKQMDNKDNYSTVECPWLIQAAIGGDIDIFKYLIDKGSLLHSVGHFTLSKKNRNSVISNILGAASFYGRVSLTHYILEKYPKVDRNFKCTEKKVKIKHFSQLSKEFSDITPVHLCIVSDIAEEDTIEILKLLHLYEANFTLTDFAKNNILHFAAKNNKLETAKFILENLKFGNLVNDLNKDGQTPIAITQNEEITQYLQSVGGGDTNKNYEELIELLETTSVKDKNKKKKKGKKNINDEIGMPLLNSTEFQETFKPPKSKPNTEETAQVKENVKENAPVSSNVNNVSISDSQNDESVSGEFHYERKSYHNKDNYGKRKYHRDNNYNNYDNKYYDDHYGGYSNNYSYKNRNNYNRNNYYEYDNTNEGNDKYYSKKRRNYQEKEKIETESIKNHTTFTSNPIQSQSKSENVISESHGTQIKPKTGLIGMSTKSKKKERKEKEKVNESVHHNVKGERHEKETPGEKPHDNSNEGLKDIDEDEIEEEDFLGEGEGTSEVNNQEKHTENINSNPKEPVTEPVVEREVISTEQNLQQEEKIPNINDVDEEISDNKVSPQQEINSHKLKEIIVSTY